MFFNHIKARDMPQLVTIPVDFKIDWDDAERPISKFREDLDEAEAAGATHLSIYSRIGDREYSYVCVDPKCVREETEQDLAIRLAKELKEKLAIEGRERAMLAKLKQKYEV